MVWLILAFSAILCFFVVHGTLAAFRGSYLTAVLVFGFVTGPILMTAAVLLAVAGKTTARTTSDLAGFTVWPDKRLMAMTLAGMAVTGVSALVLAFLVPRGMIDLPMSRRRQMFPPAMCLALAVIALAGVGLVVRRGGVGHLKFTPAMVEIVDVCKTSVLEWDDIIAINDHSDAKEGKRSGRSVVLSLRDGSEKVIGGLNMYVPNGVAIYWLVRHYWKHPEHRMELVDSLAAERFRAGHFDVT